MRSFFCFNRVSGGIGIYKLSLKNKYTTIKEPPPPPGPAPPPPLEIKEKVISESYSVVTMPFHIMMRKHYVNFYLAGGGGFRFNFIQKVSGKGSLKEYYNKNVQTDKFSEKKHAVSSAISFRGEVGFKASKHFLIISGLESTFSISPYLKNSLYKFYPHSLALRLSVAYLFH